MAVRHRDRSAPAAHDTTPAGQQNRSLHHCPPKWKTHQHCLLAETVPCLDPEALAGDGLEGCKEGRLKGKPLQLSGWTKSTKGCHSQPRHRTPGQSSKTPLTGTIPHMLEAISSCRTAVRTQSLWLFPLTQHTSPLCAGNTTAAALG